MVALSLPLLLFLALLSACAPGEVRTRPDPDFEAAVRWRSESAVNRSIDHLIERGSIWWGQWQLSRPIQVVENGVAATWQAMALESRFDDVRRPGPCRPAGVIGFYAWRRKPDSSGIDAIYFGMEAPQSQDDMAFGDWRPCPHDYSRGRGPHLLRTTLRGERYEAGWVAVGGQAHVQAVGAGAAGRPCRLASGAQLPFRCEEVPVGVTIRATLRPSGWPGDTASAPTRELVVGPAAVPGLRRFQSCLPGLPSACADLAPAFENLEMNTGPAYTTFWLLGKRYLAKWRGQTVLRTTLQVRFDPAVADSSIVPVLDSLGARVEYRGPAGTLVLHVPDPGPAPGAFARLVERWEGQAGVESVQPFAGSEDRWAPAAPAGRLETRLRDRLGRPAAAGLFCWGPRPGGALRPNPFCRAADANGVASLDSLPVFDVPVFSVCQGPGDDRTVADSTAVRVESGRTVMVRFGPIDCPAN